jgi:hypothetical protein
MVGIPGDRLAITAIPVPPEIRKETATTTKRRRVGKHTAPTRNGIGGAAMFSGETSSEGHPAADSDTMEDRITPAATDSRTSIEFTI